MTVEIPNPLELWPPPLWVAIVAWATMARLTAWLTGGPFMTDAVDPPGRDIDEMPAAVANALCCVLNFVFCYALWPLYAAYRVLDAVRFTTVVLGVRRRGA